MQRDETKRHYFWRQNQERKRAKTKGKAAQLRELISDQRRDRRSSQSFTRSW